MFHSNGKPFFISLQNKYKNQCWNVTLFTFGGARKKAQEMFLDVKHCINSSNPFFLARFIYFQLKPLTSVNTFFKCIFIPYNIVVALTLNTKEKSEMINTVTFKMHFTCDIAKVHIALFNYLLTCIVVAPNSIKLRIWMEEGEFVL